LSNGTFSRLQSSSSNAWHARSTSRRFSTASASRIPAIVDAVELPGGSAMVTMASLAMPTAQQPPAAQQPPRRW
jgi:hypothetical protein